MVIGGMSAPSLAHHTDTLVVTNFVYQPVCMQQDTVTGSDSDSEELTEYEKLRKTNITRNKIVLQRLGLLPLDICNMRTVGNTKPLNTRRARTSTCDATTRATRAQTRAAELLNEPPARAARRRRLQSEANGGKLGHRRRVTTQYDMGERFCKIKACACHRQRGNSKSTTLLLPIKMFWLRKIKARIKTEEIRRDRTSKTGKQRINSMLFHRTLDGGYDRSKVIPMSLANFSTWDLAFNHLTCFGDRFVCTIALN
jgi:hypothetical protein